MAFPIILYRNVLRTAGAILTSSGDDAGYSPGGVADHKTYGTNAWQGNVLTSPQYVNLDALAAVTADSILIVNGNIVSNAGQVKVYADTVNPPVAVAQALYSPTSDFADYKAFGALTKRYWRVEVSDPAPPFTTKPFLGEVLLGSRLTMTEYVGPDYPPRPYTVPIRGSRSDGGHYLGASRQGVARRGTLKFGGKAGVARSQFTSDLNDFLENHYKQGFPWGFILDTDDSEYAAVRWYKAPDNVKADNVGIQGVWARQTFDLPFEEAMQESVP